MNKTIDYPFPHRSVIPNKKPDYQTDDTEIEGADGIFWWWTGGFLLNSSCFLPGHPGTIWLHLIGWPLDQGVLIYRLATQWLMNGLLGSLGHKPLGAQGLWPTGFGKQFLYQLRKRVQAWENASGGLVFWWNSEICYLQLTVSKASNCHSLLKPRAGIGVHRAKTGRINLHSSHREVRHIFSAGKEMKYCNGDALVRSKI